MAGLEELVEYPREQFPDGKVRGLGIGPAAGHIGGVVTWPCFACQAPRERQGHPWQVLRHRSSPEELEQISLLVAFTPQELADAA